MPWPKSVSPKLVWTILIAACVVAWTVGAQAQTGAPPQVTQAPTPPAPPVAPTPPAPPEPAAATPAAPTAPAAAPTEDTSVGSVASLQGGASVTRNSATSALALQNPIFKGDALQTAVNGTLGITFDDETTFTLKPNTRITVDEFVYQSGGSNNAAVFNVLRGTVAFVAAEVAHTGSMKIETPGSSLGLRGTAGVVEVPEGGGAGGVSIKLYPDADGRVGRIEVFGRDGAQLGILSRGATGFAPRPGAGGRFTAVPLQISREEAERDRAFVRQTFATRAIGREFNTQRRSLQQQQRNPQRPNQPNLQRQPGEPGQPGRPGQRGQPLPRPGQPGGPPRPEQRIVPGTQPLPSPGTQPRQQSGTPPALQTAPGALPPGAKPNAPQQQPGTRPALQRQPGAVPGAQRVLGGPRKPPLQEKKKGGGHH